jgi:hypothetical protein
LEPQINSDSHGSKHRICGASFVRVYLCASVVALPLQFSVRSEFSVVKH